MNLEIKHYGRSGYNPSNIIELIIKSNNTIIVEDVTDRNSKVDENLINTLRDIADELEEQNKLIDRDKSNIN